MEDQWPAAAQESQGQGACAVGASRRGASGQERASHRGRVYTL